MPQVSQNNIARYDPSRMAGLQKRMIIDARRRLAGLIRDVRVSIVDNDCFGLQPGFRLLEELPPGAFRFERSEEKVRLFMAWLKREEEAGILQVILRPGTNRAINEAWTDTYVRGAYAQGLRRAKAEMRRAGLPTSQVGAVQLDLPLPPGIPDAFTATFRHPVHADRLGMLYTRTFEDLKTVMAEVDAVVRRKLIDGLTTGLTRGIAEGKNPKTIARELVRDMSDRMVKISYNRAELIARSEIMRAHHLATIAEYRRADTAMSVSIEAEWSTAGDGRVCEECAALAGKKYSLDEIEGLLPLHPRCRCVAIPFIDAAQQPEAQGQRAGLPRVPATQAVAA